VAGVLIIFLSLIVSQLATKLTYRRRLDKVRLHGNHRLLRIDGCMAWGGRRGIRVHCTLFLPIGGCCVRIQPPCPPQVLEEKRASLATLHTSLPRPLPREATGHRAARSVRSLKRRGKAGGGGGMGGEEYEALRVRSRSMEHMLAPGEGGSRPGSRAGLDNPNYWVQPGQQQLYSRSRSLPRHLERGERWEEQEPGWEAGGGRATQTLGREGRERWRGQAWEAGAPGRRSWREELEGSHRAEMERSWRVRRRMVQEPPARTPQAGRKSSDSSAPDTVQSSLHSLASGKSVTIAPTVEIIPRACLARRREAAEVSVNSVRVAVKEGPGQLRGERGARAEEARWAQPPLPVCSSASRNFLSDTEASEASPPVPAPVYPTLPLRSGGRPPPTPHSTRLRKERAKEPMTRHQIIDLYCKT
jgi:hypothetical protein